MKNKYKLSICSVFQNEAPFLKEWIDYHLVVGVQHFYLYNDRSTDNFYSVLEPYLKRDIVELLSINPQKENTFRTIQRKAYIQGLSQAKEESEWIAIIDIDEFIVPKEDPTLVTILERYSSYAGIAIRWQKFGTSGLKNLPPNKLMIESLTRKSLPDDEDNKITKSIIQPQLLPLEMLDLSIVIKNDIDLVHFCKWVPLNSGKVTKIGLLSFNNINQIEISLDIAQINHYWTRHENYLRSHKVTRKARLQYEDFGTPFNWYEEKIQRYIRINDQIEDLEIQRFVPLVELIR